MLDYRVINYQILVLFNVVLLVVKFSLIPFSEASAGALAVMLEIFPMILSFHTERADRLLFDSLHNSRNQLFKFKEFLTNYLPNQMIILSKDYSSSHFINKSFQEAFRCNGIDEVKLSLDSLVIEKDDIIKNKDTLELLNYTENDEDPLTISTLMNLFSKRFQILKSIQMINFEATEIRDDSLLSKLNLLHNTGHKTAEENLNIRKTSFSSHNKANTQLKDLDDQKFNLTSSVDDPSKLKRSFKVRIFPLNWD